MAKKTGSPGVMVRKKLGYTEISFHGVVNGQSRRVRTEKLVDPTKEDIAGLVDAVLTELRQASGK